MPRRAVGDAGRNEIAGLVFRIRSDPLGLRRWQSGVLSGPQNLGRIHHASLLSFSKLDQLSNSGSQACKCRDQHPIPPASAGPRKRQCQRYCHKSETCKQFRYRAVPANRTAFVIEYLARLRQSSGQGLGHVTKVCTTTPTKFPRLGILTTAFWAKHNLNSSEFRVQSSEFKNELPILFGTRNF